jgi:membrane protein
VTRREVVSTVKELARRVTGHGLNDITAALAFWAILSIFPTVLAFAAILGSMQVFIGDSAAASVRHGITDFLNRTLPANSQITVVIDDILNQSRGSLAIVAFASALWGVSKGFAGFCRALAGIAGHAGGRMGVRGRITGLVLGAATTAVSTIVLLEIVLGPLLGFEDRIPSGAAKVLLDVWSVLRFPVLGAIVVVWLAFLYKAGPGVPLRWRDQLPGAVLAAVGWVLVTAGFRLYVAVVGGANPILGVLGGAIVSLTWLYLLVMTTLIGAELNAVLGRSRGLEPQKVSQQVSRAD